MSWKNILEDPKQYMIYLEGRILQGSKEADEKYLKKLFKYRMGRELDLDHPQALNDKLQWLKINDFKPIYMYSIYDKIYCGELTLYPGSGFIQFNPMKTDYELGKLLRLPIDK